MYASQLENGRDNEAIVECNQKAVYTGSQTTKGDIVSIIGQKIDRDKKQSNGLSSYIAKYIGIKQGTYSSSFSNITSAHLVIGTFDKDVQCYPLLPKCEKTIVYTMYNGRTTRKHIRDPT